jgi:hypothetical protein
MNKKMYYIPEAIGTVLWLVMDFCWLSKMYDIALFCMLIAVASLGIAAANTFFDKDCKISERLNFVASWTWCLMNSFWFISDIPFASSDKSGIELSLIHSKILFIVSSLLVLASIVFSFIEKRAINFNRLRITNTSDTKPKTESLDSKFNESLNKSNLKMK